MKVFQFKLKKDGKGVTAMSVVADPAILIDFLKLSKEEETIKLSMNEDKMIVTGPALIPNLKIFRSAESLGIDEDGYIYFDEETVREMAQLFLMNENMNKITLGHKEENHDLKLIESWIVDNPEKDKSLELGLNVPKGTWMVSYKVENKDLWLRIKQGEFNGFSIEANGFDHIETDIEMDVDLSDEEVKQLLHETLSKVFIHLQDCE